MHKLQVMSVSTQDQYEKDMLNIQQEINRKNAELNGYVNDLKMRMKSIEDEVNEVSSDVKSSHNRSSVARSSIHQSLKQLRSLHASKNNLDQVASQMESGEDQPGGYDNNLNKSLSLNKSNEDIREMNV